MSGGGLKSLGVNVGEFGSVSDVWGLGMVVTVVGLRAWSAGDGLQALHWNMLSLVVAHGSCVFSVAGG